MNGVSSSRAFKYDENGNVTQITDGEGNVTVMQYDARGNQILRRDAEGNTVTHTYNDQNQVLTETTYLTPDPDKADPTNGNLLGNPSNPLTTYYVYDEHQNLRFVISPEGRVSEFRYDMFGQRSSSIQYVSSNKYTAAAVAANLSDLTVWVSNTANKVQEHRTDYTYDFRGQLSSTVVYGSFTAEGYPISAVVVTHYVYDQAGNLLQTIAPLGQGQDALQQAAQTTTYTYDGLGRLLSTTNGLGQLTQYQYADASKITQGIKKDVTTTKIDPNGLVTISTFDGAGCLIRTFTGTASSPSAYGYTIYSYDKNGKLHVVSDDTGTLDYFAYDALGRKIQVIDGNGSATIYAYNKNDQITASIRRSGIATIQTGLTIGGTLDLSGNNNVQTTGTSGTTTSADDPSAPAYPEDRQTTYFYDHVGRLVKQVGENGAVTETQYDGASRKIATIERANTLASPTDVVQPNGLLDRTTRYFYDGDGLLSGVVDSKNYYTKIEHDSAGNETKRTEYANALIPQIGGSVDPATAVASSMDRISSSIFDARNLLIFSWTSTGQLGGRYTKYTYDANGNLLEKRVQSVPTMNINAPPPELPTDHIETYRYDALNRLVLTIDASGSVTQTTYDSAGNIVMVREYATQVSRNDDGSLTVSVPPMITTQDHVRRNVYNTNNQLIYQLGADGVLTQYTYNQRGKVIEEKAFSRTVNLATMSADATTWRGTLDALVASLPYTTDQDMRITRYTYDRAGRCIQTTRKNVAVYNETLDAARSASVAGSVSRAEVLRDIGSFTVYNEFNEVKSAGEVVSDSAQVNGVGLITTQVRHWIDIKASIAYTMDAAGYVTITRYDAFGDVVSEARLATSLVNSRRSLAQLVNYSLADLRAALPFVPGAVSLNGSWALLNQSIYQNELSGDNRITYYAYDQNGNKTMVLSSAGFDGRANAANMKLDRFTYNAWGEVTQENISKISGTKDSMGIFSISPETSLSSTKHYYDRGGFEYATLDAMNYVTFRKYDVFGNLKASNEVAQAVVVPVDYTEDYFPTAVDTNGDRYTTYVYDKNNRMRTKTTRDQYIDTNSDMTLTQMQAEIALHGDSYRNLSIAMTYDAFGNIATISNYQLLDSMGGPSQVSNYYDMENRLRATVGAIHATKNDPNFRGSTEYTYNV